MALSLFQLSVVSPRVSTTNFLRWLCTLRDVVRIIQHCIAWAVCAVGVIKHSVWGLEAPYNTRLHLVLYGPTLCALLLSQHSCPCFNYYILSLYAFMLLNSNAASNITTYAFVDAITLQ